MNNKITNQKKNVSGVSEKKVYLYDNLIEIQSEKWRHSNKDLAKNAKEFFVLLYSMHIQ